MQMSVHKNVACITYSCLRASGHAGVRALGVALGDTACRGGFADVQCNVFFNREVSQIHNSVAEAIKITPNQIKEHIANEPTQKTGDEEHAGAEPELKTSESEPGEPTEEPTKEPASEERPDAETQLKTSESKTSKEPTEETDIKSDNELKKEHDIKELAGADSVASGDAVVAAELEAAGGAAAT